MDTTNRRQRHSTGRLDWLATALLIAVTLLVGSLTVWDRVHSQNRHAAAAEPSLPKNPVSIDGAPSRGDRNATVALIEFSDFECPYSGKSATDVMPDIDRQYVNQGKLLHVWRHYPLPIHKHAEKAAEAAECAGTQGNFWAFHNWAFQHQRELDGGTLREAARVLQLEPTAFAACLDGQMAVKVQADIALGNALSVSGTPTWLIGVLGPDHRVRVTGRLDGAQPLTSFQLLIDRAIATVEGPATRQGTESH